MPKPASGNIRGRMEAVESVCARIRTHPDVTLTLAELSSIAGMSSFHFQRTFKQLVGVTPRQFAASCRLDSLKQQLRARPVTEAIYEAGYGSASRVYESSDLQLGMTPATYGAGGRGASISYVSLPTPLGPMLIGATDRGICFAQFGDPRVVRAELRREFSAADLTAVEPPLAPQLQAWTKAIAGHIETGGPSPLLPLDLRATAFQIKVWNYLRTIPSGETRSYMEAAAAIGKPTAARAIARACAANRVAIVIPCHRVIRGTGEFGGYRWGVERKEALLEAERNS